MNELHDGTWYLCARCPACKHLFAYTENPGDNDDPPTGFAGSMPMTCPKCAHAFVFDATQTVVRQAHATPLGVRL